MYTDRYTYIERQARRAKGSTMPISVQVTRGLLTPAGEGLIVPRIAAALLECHGLERNAFMQENVIGHLFVSEAATAYVGGRPQSLAVVEVKVPSVTFRDRAVQEKFVATVTDVIDELKAGTHPKSRTFVNVTYAVDGTWGIAGKAYTNEELGAAIAAAFSH
jgi:phenylpyruvate tautomerase PptA (4-oxalocrotonate tautomerase family)